MRKLIRWWWRECRCSRKKGKGLKSNVSGFIKDFFCCCCFESGNSFSELMGKKYGKGFWYILFHWKRKEFSKVWWHRVEKCLFYLFSILKLFLCCMIHDSLLMKIRLCFHSLHLYYTFLWHFIYLTSLKKASNIIVLPINLGQDLTKRN